MSDFLESLAETAHGLEQSIKSKPDLLIGTVDEDGIIIDGDTDATPLVRLSGGREIVARKGHKLYALAGSASSYFSVIDGKVCITYQKEVTE